MKLAMCVGVALSIIIAGGLGSGGVPTHASTAPGTGPTTRESVALLMAVVIDDEKGLTIIFELHNSSENEMLVYDLMLNDNAPYLVSPSGKEVPLAGGGQGTKMRIPSGQSKRWRVRMSQLLRVETQEESGVWMLRWRVGSYEAAGIALVRERVDAKVSTTRKSQ